MHSSQLDSLQHRVLGLTTFGIYDNVSEMDGKDAESLAESATLVEDDLVARSCTSSISEAATEKQDVEYGKTSSKAGPDAPSVTRELEPVSLSPRCADITLTHLNRRLILHVVCPM